MPVSFTPGTFPSRSQAVPFHRLVIMRRDIQSLYLDSLLQSEVTRNVCRSLSDSTVPVTRGLFTLNVHLFFFYSEVCSRTLIPALLDKTWGWRKWNFHVACVLHLHTVVVNRKLKLNGNKNKTFPLDGIISYNLYFNRQSKKIVNFELVSFDHHC